MDRKNLYSETHTQEKNRLIVPLLVFASCALYMISGGIRANFSIMMKALAEHARVDYADVSFAAAVGQLMYGLTQPLFGILALRKSNGFVLVLGAVLMAAGLLLTAFASSKLALVATVGLLFFSGTGAVCFGIIMGTISPILGQRRASAVSGILNASSGIGASLLAPIMQRIQASAGVDRLLLVLTVPALILIPACLWISGIARRSPVEARASGESEGQSAIAKLRAAIADPDYRRLMIGFGTCGFHMCIIQSHISAQIVSYGIPEETASHALTVFGLTSMVGSMLCGLLCQKLPLKNVLGSLYGIRAVMVAVFLFLLPKTAAPIFLFIIVLGMTGDATVTPTSEIVSRRFGPESLGFLFGITFVCHQIGGFISTWLGGIFISSSENYQAIWLIDIALCAMATIASYRIHKNVTALDARSE